ncbi:transposase [Escherichia coli]|nr:transposase [Escherichia coli]
MSQKYLIRIAELERLLSEQAEALRQKDQQLSLVEETEAFLRSALTRAEVKWSTKTGHRVRVFPVSIFRFVWG